MLYCRNFNPNESTAKVDEQCPLCDDPDCKRRVVGTEGGRLYVVNIVTCGKFKKLLKDYKKKK